jgi:hypothetical protein
MSSREISVIPSEARDLGVAGPAAIPLPAEVTCELPYS